MSIPRVPRRPALLLLLAGFIYLEAAALGVIAAVLLVDIFLQHPDSYLSAVALIVLSVLASVWLAVMGTHALRGRPWIRGGIVTWQILQAIIGITAIAGGSSVGWVLLIVALIVLIVLFSRPVVLATRRPAPER